MFRNRIDRAHRGKQNKTSPLGRAPHDDGSARPVRKGGPRRMTGLSRVEWPCQGVFCSLRIVSISHNGGCCLPPVVFLQFCFDISRGLFCQCECILQPCRSPGCLVLVRCLCTVLHIFGPDRIFLQSHPLVRPDLVCSLHLFAITFRKSLDGDDEYGQFPPSLPLT